jgi:3-polyprenyl-4-hydroxybenzoate decarboxylase
MSQDLRSYLDRIKKNQPDDFLAVSREVDPAFEITAITTKFELVINLKTAKQVALRSRRTCWRGRIK